MIYGIVTADRNWGIGKNGRQITNIPDDIRYIRSVTSGQSVIMGRKTFESIPTAQLPVNRTNIVVSRNPLFKAVGAEVFTSIEDAVARAREASSDIYVLGGGELYSSMLSYCDEIQVTFVDYSYDTDTYFPNLDKLPEWVLVEESEEQTHFDTVFYLRRYLKRSDYKA